MDCVTRSSLAAGGMFSVVYPRAAEESLLRSSHWPINSFRISGRCFNVRISPLFSSSSSSPELSATAPFGFSPVAAFNNTAPLQTQSILSSSTEEATKAGNESLSAKERRKLRNERREEAKASQEQPWKEIVENKLLEKKKKIRGWSEDADLNRCISKGFAWWMVQVTRRFEFDVAEHISRRFPETFPGTEFEVIVPTVPMKNILKDGSVSTSRKKLYDGIVLLRCVLNRDVYTMVKRIPRVYEFFGNLAGLSLQPVIMPAPVSNVVMETMFQQMRKEEEEYAQVKEQCRKDAEEQRREKQRKNEEQKKRQLEQKMLQSKSMILEAGATVRILSGPFADFRGIVTELLPQVNKVKTVVTVFGNNTSMELDVENVVVEAAAPYQ